MKILFQLCLNLRMFILDPSSMPLSTIVNSKSLYRFNQMINDVFLLIHNRSSIRDYSGELMDFFVDFHSPFRSNRWFFTFDPMNVVTYLGIIYFPKEFVPLYRQIRSKTFADYLLGQLLSIEVSRTFFATSITSFSLEQNYLNVSSMRSDHLHRIQLISQGKNHFFHRFTFQVNTTALARNLTLMFIDLPNSPNYFFTIDVTYNRSCHGTKSDLSKIYSVNVNLQEEDHFVFSLPIEPMSMVCAQLEIVTKNFSIRNLKRLSTFLLIETGCYSFNAKISEDYFYRVFN